MRYICADDHVSSLNLVRQVPFENYSLYISPGAFMGMITCPHESDVACAYVSDDESPRCVRCMYGDDHVSTMTFENKFLRAGGCSELGDLDEETRKELKEICDDRLGFSGDRGRLCSATKSQAQVFV